MSRSLAKVVGMSERSVLPPEQYVASLARKRMAGFAFVDREDVAGLVTPLLARRVATCLNAVETGSVAALENGSPAA